MKVFISWSGETSKNIAEILRQWLPGVIQALKPYYSPDDITKGTRWSSEISKELDASKVGIICLTKDNLESPWIMFEAGALSKNIDKSKVCPILFNVDPTDIQGPLIQFQAAKFSKNEIKKVVKMMNSELADSSLTSDVLDSVFEMWWPKLNERIDSELSKAITNGKTADIRPERDILEEILTLTRDISIVKSKRREKDQESTIDFEAFAYIVKRLEQISLELNSIGNIKSLDLLRGIIDPFIYILDKVNCEVSPSRKEETIERLNRILDDNFELHKLIDEKLKPIAKKPNTK